MSKQYFIFLLFLSLTVFCNKKSFSQSNTDQSLTLNEYENLGLPSLDKKWQLSDFNEANKVLQKVKEENYYHLPKINSSKSGMVFQKFLTLSNQYNTVSQIGNSHDKGNLVKEINFLMISFMQNYFINYRPNIYYSSEITSLFKFSLNWENQQISFIENFLKKDNTVENSNLTNFKIGYTEIILGILQQFNDYKDYNVADLEPLSNQLKDEVRTHKVYLYKSKIPLLISSSELLEKSAGSLKIKENLSLIADILKS